MPHASSSLTRRQTLTLPLLAVATPALAHMPAPDFVGRLRAALARLPSGEIPADLTLCRFDAGPGACTAVIRLDWPPGMRQRRFTANGDDSEAAFSALLAEIETYFKALV